MIAALKDTNSTMTEYHRFKDELIDGAIEDRKSENRLMYKMAGVAGTLLGGIILGAFSLGGCWGSRGISDEVNFKYKGRHAVVQHDDIRYGMDRYWVMLDGKDKILDGCLTSDDGRVVTINCGEKYTVKEAER